LTHEHTMAFSIMERSFVLFTEAAHVHQDLDEILLTVGPSPEPKHMVTLNDTAADILQQCDGCADVGTIAERHRVAYGIERSVAESSVAAIVNRGLAAGYLRLSPEPTKNAIGRSGSRSHHAPQHVALELTSRCNLTCRHCYGDFGPRGDEEVPLSRWQGVLSDLLGSGVRILTLTGGEPFLYGSAVGLLEWVLPRFMLVGVISNGTVVPDAAIELLGKHKDKVLVQLTINGHREFHDAFVGREGAFDRVVACASKLVARGVRVRLAMNACTGNVGQIQHVAGLAHELGVALMAVSVSQNLGRERLHRQGDQFYEGKDPNNNLEMVGLVSEQVAAAKRTHPHLFRSLPRNELEAVTGMAEAARRGEVPTITCGAGQRSIYLAANGDVHACALAKSCGFPALGNLLQGSLEQAMTSRVARALAGLCIPLPPLCDSQCSQLPFCGGCVVRGYAGYMSLGERCTWGTRSFGPRDRWLANVETDATHAACR